MEKQTVLVPDPWQAAVNFSLCGLQAFSLSVQQNYARLSLTPTTHVNLDNGISFLSSLTRCRPSIRNTHACREWEIFVNNGTESWLVTVAAQARRKEHPNNEVRMLWNFCNANRPCLWSACVSAHIFTRGQVLRPNKRHYVCRNSPGGWGGGLYCKCHFPIRQITHDLQRNRSLQLLLQIFLFQQTDC